MNTATANQRHLCPRAADQVRRALINANARAILRFAQDRKKGLELQRLPRELNP
jgi:hypothetical protein